MKSAILLELAKRWEQDAVEPETQDGSPSAQEFNAIRKGERQAKRQCADALRMLVYLLGDSNEGVQQITLADAVRRGMTLDRE